MTARHLLLPLALSASVACADLTAPSGGVTGSAEGHPRVVVQEAAQAAPAPAPAPTPPPPAPAPAPAQDAVRASHILVAYKGATRAKPTITRSKAEAKKLAESIATRAKKGEDFAKLAQELSDGPSGPRGGDLGKFTRERMVKPFSDAAFALQPGAVSGVVETQFGFHVIKRTE